MNWERSKRPPFDNAAGSNMTGTCMCAAEWIDNLLGVWPWEKYQAVQSLILFETQIPQIEKALLHMPQILHQFRKNVHSRKEFDVVVQSSGEVVAVYNKMRDYRNDLPVQSWPLEHLFEQMDIVSRHFMAKVELSYAQIFLTKDHLKRDMARCFGLHCEVE
jgi:hypothetical protein